MMLLWLPASKHSESSWAFAGLKAAGHLLEKVWGASKLAVENSMGLQCIKQLVVVPIAVVAQQHDFHMFAMICSLV